MTDRVEINPDNTNKPLEQSQEDLAKQGINVNESQVNANGESINISEPDNKVQSSEDEARPNWLPEKFASAEELAKAYGELEKKMSSPKEEVPESTEEAPEEVQQLDKYYEEYTENNELSDKSYTELESMGLSRDLVDGYIAGQKALADNDVATIHNVVGGQDNYANLLDWSAKNLSQSEKGDTENVATDVFKSVAQVTEAMNDPRYSKDPAFRKEVEDKLARSSVI